MEQLMIVDDDEILLEGLTSMVDWSGMHIRVIASMTNGVDALKRMRENPCGILLTDIKMGRMNGLELTEAVRREFPQTRVVMLSAYEDFSFAQKAVRLGVSDYLLKPVDLEQLRQTMERIVRELAERRQREEEISHMSRRIAELEESKTEEAAGTKSAVHTGAIDQLCQAVLLGNPEGADIYGRLLEQSLRKNGAQPEALLQALEYAMGRMWEDEAFAPEDQALLSDMYRNVVDAADFADGMKRFQDDLLSLAQAREMTAQNATGLICRACSYMDENYGDSSLRARDVARYVGLSTSYFSAVFAQIQGEAFSDYLQRIRMEKAQNLLVNTGLKSYEIADRVGYDNPSYFSTLFKKYWGMTVSQYRNAFGRKNERFQKKS